MGSRVDDIDAWLFRLRSEAVRRRRRRTPINPDRNRRWEIIRYLWERGAVIPEKAVGAREIAEALGISMTNCLTRLGRMRGVWVNRIGVKREYRWFLSEKALRFLEKWDPLNHPWIKRERS